MGDNGQGNGYVRVFVTGHELCAALCGLAPVDNDPPN